MINDALKAALANVQKPGRYTGGEVGSVYKDKKEDKLRFAFCFPDTYEIGMSFLGMKILYEILNANDDFWCERVFMPWVDMLSEMKNNNIPLFAIESKDELKCFDIVGFTLQYELSYTNILAMLDLSDIPLYASQRGEEYPLIVAGGPCACNAEPLANFFDLIMLGEGEKQLEDVCAIVNKCKKNKVGKHDMLKKLSRLEGVYIPSFYEVEYKEDNHIKSIKATNNAPNIVTKAIIKDMSKQPLPTNFVVPMIGAIHDRAQIEVLRGCVRGCRFCQAGFLYRPMRERAPEMLSDAGSQLCQNTGYDEISLTSLSTSDHSQLESLLDKLLVWTDKCHVNISLPSLRIDNFNQSLIEKISRVRKSGLTFAPEAGTQRLRDVINKNVTWDEIERSCTTAFKAGYTSVKLYFMLGLPTETFEDVAGIAETAQKVVNLYYQNPDKPKGKGVQVSISVSCFVPKPMTPFQYCPQDTQEMLAQKQKYLLSCVTSRKISVSYHDNKTSFLEAVFAKGDRRLSQVLETAYKAGCIFDGWGEEFRYDTWIESFKKCGIDPSFYANQPLELDILMPWSHLDYGVSEEYLQSEYKKAISGSVTQPCNKACSACGANKLLGGVCFAYNKN